MIMFCFRTQNEPNIKLQLTAFQYLFLLLHLQFKKQFLALYEEKKHKDSISR